MGLLLLLAARSRGGSRGGGRRRGTRSSRRSRSSGGCVGSAGPRRRCGFQKLLVGHSVALEDARQRELPSLCPTMFSEMYTGTCCLPLWTAMVSPTKSGKIVERRDQVLIGRLSLAARAAPTFFTRWWSTKGPFLTERPMV